jgi:hypothetical protein
MSLLNFLPSAVQKEPWQIDASRFCVDNSELGFSYEDLRTYIQKKYKVRDSFIQYFFNEEIKLPSGRKWDRENDVHTDKPWSAPLDLVSKITDFDELKEARKNSTHAFWLSVVSILIALVSFLVTVFK